MATQETLQAQVEGLATLLILDEETRNLNSLREFGFFVTNETHRLLPYHTAYLWQQKELISTHIVAQSGTAEIDIHTIDNQWLIQKIKEIKSSDKANEIHTIDFTHTENWPEAFPHYVMWCPFLDKNNQLNGGLIFFRENSFNESEIKMVRWLIGSYQYTWQILTKPTKIPSWKKLKEKPYLIGALVATTLFLLFPIRLSVFGDATVAAKNPILINAPLEGVIKSFAVNSGQTVKAGQLLLTLDKTDLQAAVDIIKKDLQLTQEKLRTLSSTGFENKESRAEIPIAQAQLAIDKAHLDYANELLAKADITSPISGVVILDSKEDWVGQPVRTGERILIIADPKQVELKITIPVANMIPLAVGSKGAFFPYGQLHSLPLKLKTLGYNAKLLPNKILAYQLAAEFTENKDLPQLGIKGTVKVYGHVVPMIYYLLKRPLQALRQMIGI